MSCACCQLREGNKKNTHYLTDAIIRSCLNVDGSADREKGLYANMSLLSHVEIGFQRSTSPETLEVEMKRLPNEDEIERAKKNPYSVDNVFCGQCEALFTEIENEFTKEILPKLRTGNLSDTSMFVSSEVKTIRLLFYLQLWRSSICLPEFALSPSVMENFRQFILNHKTVTEDELRVYPLSVTYLETLGDLKEFTKNYIAHFRFKNPFVLLMNDFIIQFFESESDVKFIPLYNINDGNFSHSINLNETEFATRILPDVERKTFLRDYTADLVKERIEFYTKWFVGIWSQLTGSVPAQELIGEYLYVLTKNDDESILNYTQEVVASITRDFVADKLNIAK